MRLFKCLVPVLVLLLVEGSSATWCLMHRFMIFHDKNNILHRTCDFKQKQHDPTSAPPPVNGTMNIFNHGATQINGNGTATSTGVTNTGSPDLWQFLTNYTLSVIDGMQSKPNHSPSQGAVPEQSEQPGQWVLVPFEATNAGGGAGPSTLSGSGSAYTTQAPGENSTSIADVNAGSSRDDGFGGIAGNTGINFGGSGSSGSGQEGYDASNREFSSNANADAVPTTDASSGSWTDGSDGSSAYRQDSSGGLSSAIFNANSNTSGGLASSSSKSTASSQPAAQYQRMTRIQHPAMLRPAQTPTSNR